MAILLVVAVGFLVAAMVGVDGAIWAAGALLLVGAGQAISISRDRTRDRRRA